MSLEERIAELTEAVKANSELLTVLTSKARASIEAPAPKSKADEPKAKSEDAEEAAPKPRGRKPKAEKAPSVSDMKNAAKAYLDAADDEDDYKARRAKIKAIVEKFGAAKFTEIAEEHRVEALAMLNGETEEEEDDDVV